MEDNLFYIDNSIFTKKPHIYLNLNTSVQKNLNVIQNTNLNKLYVENTSNFNGLITGNNLYIKENTILNGYVTINNNTIIKYNEDSNHYNNGSLVLRGGLGINKKLNVGKDVVLYENLNVKGNTNINRNLNVFSNVNIYKNLNVFSNTNIDNELYVKNNIIGDSSLNIKKDSIFQSNLSIYGNLAVYGKMVNIESERTIIGDPLVVFGFNQTKTYTDNAVGGFVISYNDNNNRKYTGLVRKPISSNYYLYNNLSEHTETGEPIFSDLDNHKNYSDLYLYNINVLNDTTIDNNLNVKHYVQIDKNTLIYGNTTIHNNLNVLSNVNITEDIRNYGNTKIDNTLETNTLIVNSSSNLKGITNVENTLQSDYYKLDYGNKTVNINGVTTLEKDVKMNADVEVVGDLHNYGNTLVDNNLTTNSLVVNSTSNLKGITNVENTLQSDYYKLDYADKTVNIDGVTTLEKDVKMNADVEVVGDVRNYGNTVVDNNLTTNSLVVNSTSNLKGITNVENTLQSDYYKLDYGNKTVNIDGVTTLEKDVKMNADVEVVGDVHNYGNTVVDNNLTTNSLVVNSTSNLKGITNVENTLQSDYYKLDYGNKTVNIDGVTTLEKDVKMNADVEVVGVT